MRDFVIITPVRSPAPGGGAEYTRLLATGLDQNPACGSVSVISEKPPYRADGPGWPDAVELDDFFPMRAGARTVNAASYVRYAEQQAKALLLSRRIPRDAVVIIHSSFHYKIGTWGLVVRMLRQRRPDLCLISDVRDPVFPNERQSILRNYDGVIVCSRSAENSLKNSGTTPVKLIPIPFDGSNLEPLHRDVPFDRYVLCPHGVREDKNVSRFVDMATELRKNGHIDGGVIIGKTRGTVPPLVTAAIADGTVLNLGPVTHPEVLGFMRSALATIILSQIEGLPRASLETIAVGGRLLVDKGLEEYAVIPPILRLDSDMGAAELAQRLGPELGRLPDTGYSLAPHHPSEVVRSTIEFANFLSTR